MGKVGRFVTKRILFLNLRGALTKDMQAVVRALKDAPDRGGNAREKTSERFHFYSPTSAAGARGVYHVPTPTFLPRRGCTNLRQISQGDGTSSTFKYILHTKTPRAPSGGRGAIEVRRLRRGRLRSAA